MLALLLSNLSPPWHTCLEALTPGSWVPAYSEAELWAEQLQVSGAAVGHQILLLGQAGVSSLLKNYYPYSKLTFFHINSHLDFSKSSQVGHTSPSLVRQEPDTLSPPSPSPKRWKGGCELIHRFVMRQWREQQLNTLPNTSFPQFLLAERRQRRSEALCARCQPFCNFFLSSQTENIRENCRLSTTATLIALEVIQELKFFSKWVKSQTVAGKSGKIKTLKTPGHPQKHLHHPTQTWSTSACQIDDWQLFTKGCFQDSAILPLIHVCCL